MTNFKLNAAKKVEQGFDVDQQYRAVNAARTKRVARRRRNVTLLTRGGFTQVPIIKCR